MRKNNFKSVLRSIWNMKESGIIIPTILYAIFVQLINPAFMSGINVASVFRQSGFILISAIGMTLVLISGGIDLSVGSVMGLGGYVTGATMVNLGFPIWMGIIVAMLAGAALGCFNGLVLVRFKIPPMIMTLGVMYIARGIVFIATRGLPIYPLPEDFQSIEQSNLFGIPSVVFICVVLCVLFHIILKNTTFGRSVYAIGGNRDAAKLSGININKITVMVYAISGLMAATTGIIMSSRLGSAQPSLGEGYEMNVIAACIIGGTSTFGGRGTILGTVFGALLMSMLSNSMTLMKIDVYYQKLAIGAVLIIAAIIDQYKRELALKQVVHAK